MHHAVRAVLEESCLVQLGLRAAQFRSIAVHRRPAVVHVAAEEIMGHYHVPMPSHT